MRLGLAPRRDGYFVTDCLERARLVCSILEK